jgi:hypothetical protein
MKIAEFAAEFFAGAGIGFLIRKVAGDTFGIRGWSFRRVSPRRELSKFAGVRESLEGVCCLSVLQTAQIPAGTLLEKDPLCVPFVDTLPQILLSGGEDMLRPPRQLTRSRPSILGIHRRS